MSDYSIVNADEVDNPYADGDVPGEFRALTDALGSEQVEVTSVGRRDIHAMTESGCGDPEVVGSDRSAKALQLSPDFRMGASDRGGYRQRLDSRQQMLDGGSAPRPCRTARCTVDAM